MSAEAHEAVVGFASESHHALTVVASGVLMTWSRLSRRQQELFAGLSVADDRERRLLAEEIARVLAEAPPPTRRREINRGTERWR